MQLVFLLGFLLLAQVATLTHRIDHGAKPDRAGCVLCLAAGHMAGPVSETPQFLHRPGTERPTDALFRSRARTHQTLYDSRAPPIRR